MTGPAALVDAYLQACEDRDLATASGYLAPGVRMQFPGGVTYASLEDMVAAPKPYAWVRKHRDRYEVGTDGDRTTVVSTGRLHGRRHDGSEFADVRYIDLFTLRADLIVEQLVWNDLPLAGPWPASTTA
ncbi:nuclear transport factor 2 family protein [Nocardioides zeae]|uniref:Nuclear transport factor 2 family protein n=1 Tax=Nocardioides imazamoxiresistens TaxID=3231893 RepID=A0ABU3PXP7_9ACTN|nr:nuclear transport factor 2 family protein [Nocardioides zeae]MDT9593592.1 nuclear transport factor 2 family protein [Nocardioides zeae]